VKCLEVNQKSDGIEEHRGRSPFGTGEKEEKIGTKEGKKNPREKKENRILLWTKENFCLNGVRVPGECR